MDHAGWEELRAKALEGLAHPLLPQSVKPVLRGMVQELDDLRTRVEALEIKVTL